MLLYACTIFLSAFLLFQVQPVIARMILPWFGGSAAVWTTCMLFFQVLLLGGYLYVHWAVRALKPKTHAYLHCALLAASLLLLPITPGPQWKPGPAENPTINILLLLAACVGMQFFLLSTSSPLIQSWYARTGRGVLPYRLFALSNLGSLLALLSYPFLVEPYLATKNQGTAWSVSYGVFVALCIAAAIVTTRRAAARPEAASGVEVSAGARAPRPGEQLFWVGLAFVPSAMLLAVTNHLTQDVAALPFLWVAPLSIYLLSFVLCFDAAGWYRRAIFLPLIPPALGGMAYVLFTGTEDYNLRILLAVFSLCFFVACMVCHGELVRLKPHPRYLTSFYLMLSIGGALGGVFVGVIAPYLFISYFEFPILLVLCGALVLYVIFRDPESPLYRGWLTPAGVLAIACLISLTVFCARAAHKTVGSYKIVKRNFYGALRVREDRAGTIEAYRTLLHGAINHGEQWIHPDRRDELLTYYCADTGVGRAIRSRPLAPRKIGVFGLGAGTLAAYGRPGDTVRFYEINPMVLWLAMTEFYFLPEARAKVEVALGDARLSLESEPPQNFDVLAVDCFSGDSIPVHLLTREAVELYFRHLKPDGILALHVSNRYIELEPVIERIATSLGKATLQVETEEDEDGNCFATTWVLVAPSKESFSHKVFEGAGQPVAARPKLRVWTDDYSSLFGVLK